MSVDTYVMVRREQDQWVGYLESASLENPQYVSPVFSVERLDDAVLHAQITESEYGYKFEGLTNYEHKT